MEYLLKKFCISNGETTKIKLLIIELFKRLEKNKLIENKYKIVYKNRKSKTIKKKDLTPLIISKSEFILFNEI